MVQQWKKPFEKAKALEFEKKKEGIAWHIDASSVVWTHIQRQISQSDGEISGNCGKISINTFHIPLEVILISTSSLIIYVKKIFHADWLRACQLIPNSAKTWNFFDCWKTKLVQKLEIKLIDRKVAKEKLTDEQSNLLFSNQAHALDGAIFPWLRDTPCVPSAQPSRNFFINQHGEIFACILLTGNQMIFLVQFGISKHS